MKQGFTLAEVLITLGVIGVVAAMTIPSVIKKYQEQVTVNKVKKFYSMMSQAYMLSVKDNGYANEWNVGNGLNSTTANQIATYLKPYLKIIKDCETNSGCLKYKDKVNLLKGTKHVVNYDTMDYFYKIILSDGSYIWWRGVDNWCKQNVDGVSNICVIIWTDTNGGKEPNTIGKDIFEFLLTPYGVKPALVDDCNKTNNGWGCSSYILKNGNMDYLK